MTDERVFEVATANRLLAADLLESLTPEQWRTPSLCEGWTVREVAAHLVPPAEGFTSWGMLKLVVRFRGDLARMVDTTAREGARHPTDEIVRQLRERSGVQLDPPVTHAWGPMSDTAIHLRDIARPLGSDVCPPPEDWRAVLDFLVSKPARRGFLPKGRLDGLRLVATDLEWSSGQGAEVHGAAEALAMAVSGRSIALPDLAGAGQHELARRVG